MPTKPVVESYILVQSENDGSTVALIPFVYAALLFQRITTQSFTVSNDIARTKIMQLDLFFEDDFQDKGTTSVRVELDLFAVLGLFHIVSALMIRDLTILSEVGQKISYYDHIDPDRATQVKERNLGAYNDSVKLADFLKAVTHALATDDTLIFTHIED
jgi:hypothetical protein